MLFVYLFIFYFARGRAKDRFGGIDRNDLYTFWGPHFLLFVLVFERFCEYNMFCEPCVGSFCFGKSTRDNEVFPGQNTYQKAKMSIFQISSKCTARDKMVYREINRENHPTRSANFRRTGR